MRSLSVTTMSRTSSCGALASTSRMRPRWPGVIHSPRARRKMWLNSWQARPTVGVYTIGSSSSRWSTSTR
jgi:hypothetical protein